MFVRYHLSGHQAGSWGAHQRSAPELSMMWRAAISALSNMVAMATCGLLNMCNVAGATEFSISLHFNGFKCR